MIPNVYQIQLSNLQIQSKDWEQCQQVYTVKLDDPVLLFKS